MAAHESKPTSPLGERILLTSLSWDHTDDSADAKIKTAMRFWRGKHGMTADPNLCLVPAAEKDKWPTQTSGGLPIRATPSLLSGQIMLELVIVPDSQNTTEEA